MQNKDLLRKLRVCTKCKYIGDDDSPYTRLMGFLLGRTYYITERAENGISFTNHESITAIDFGLSDGGDYFFEHWLVVNKSEIAWLPDIDFSSKYVQKDWSLIELNSKVK